MDSGVVRSSTYTVSYRALGKRIGGCHGLSGSPLPPYFALENCSALVLAVGGADLILGGSTPASSPTSFAATRPGGAPRSRTPTPQGPPPHRLGHAPARASLTPGLRA